LNTEELLQHKTHTQCQNHKDSSLVFHTYNTPSTYIEYTQNNNMPVTHISYYTTENQNYSTLKCAAAHTQFL